MADVLDKEITPSVLAVILGGGQGTRLFPLTKERAKPAVPLAGKYRLVDIPISNCIHSGYLRMYLLTQFNSASLHRHISQAYKFDPFSGGFVEILAAEQTMTDRTWYEGTVDAVRKNLVHLAGQPFECLLVLSGDQLYHMDYRLLVTQHIRTQAEITVGTIPVTRKDVPGLGIMRVAGNKITDFVEKPKDPAVQDQFRLEKSSYSLLGINGGDDLFLASMGIYVFSRSALFELMAVKYHDFGKELIPDAIKTRGVHAYVYQGAWKDIGTIRAFFDVNLDLATPHPEFEFFDPVRPFFTRPRFLPAAKIGKAMISQSLISEGCLIDEAVIHHSVIGLRSMVRAKASVQNTIMMGSDYYQTPAGIQADRAVNRPLIGIGCNSRIDTAIIDKNARIGDDCVITPAGKPQDFDHPLCYVRDGIVVIPKNAVIPHGTRI